MSHWPRKIRNRRRRQHFWIKLFLVSFIAHCTVLFSVLFLYKGDYFSYDVTVGTELLQSGAPVVFMPFHKIVNKQPVVSTVKKVINTVPKKKMKTIQQCKKRTTVTAATKPKKKLVAKKEQVQKKREKTRVAFKKKKRVKKVVTQKPERLLTKAVQPKTDQSPLYVGQVEMEGLRMQEQLQQEMSQHWKPPVGLTKDLECVLKVLIDWSGNVNATEVHKSSGVLMYDISARTAIAQMKMPKWAQGKEFNITFKQ